MKKILNIFSLFVFTILTSCSIDDNGEMHLTWLFWFLLIGFILMIVFAGVTGSKENEEVKKKLSEKGLNDADFIPTAGAVYVGGHPDMDQNFTDVHFMIRETDLAFYFKPPFKYPAQKFSIPKAVINAIEIEDATSIEKKLTVGRLILVGVFAFAWKKKKKNELAFVTINWNDGKFNHTTIFNLEGKDAMQRANTLRNKLINAVR